ncbi:MAG: MFS transporter [Roseitalea sp.]|jgi:MFS family permease|nr:MFS transporter [Roseitalea sp.]MBO6720556.1 MFS transporter [Roseitalea sp.]MBO6743703.1 MFS transporter [Roseitalea sp.]
MLRNIVPVTGLMLSTFFLLAGSGLTGITLPLRAGLEGWSPVVIGWIGFGYALSFTAGCVVVPRMVRRVGHVRVYAVLATLLAMSLLFHALIVHPLAWIAFRGVAGFALAGAYMVVESWLNEKATNESRGQIFSFYMIMNMVGMMAGQFMVLLGDPATTTLFIIAALLYAMAVIPTGLSNAVSPQPLTQVTLDLRKLYRNSPAAMVGMLMTGIIAGIWNFQAPVFAEQIGLSSNQIPLMLALAMISGAVFQLPLGRASDRMDRRYVMIFAGVVGVGCAIAYQIVPGAASAPGIFITVFVLGAVLFPIYSLVVAHANDYAEPSEFVEISSGLLVVNGAGAMIGPLLSGFLIVGLGPGGFFLSLAIAFAVFAGYAAWRITQRQAAPAEEMTDYTYMPATRSQTPETFNLDPRSDEE